MSKLPERFLITGPTVRHCSDYLVSKGRTHSVNKLISKPKQLKGHNGETLVYVASQLVNYKPYLKMIKMADKLNIKVIQVDINE